MISKKMSNLQQEVPSRKLTYPTKKEKENTKKSSSTQTVFLGVQKYAIFFPGG